MALVGEMAAIEAERKRYNSAQQQVIRAQKREDAAAEREKKKKEIQDKKDKKAREDKNAKEVMRLINEGRRKGQPIRVADAKKIVM